MSANIGDIGAHTGDVSVADSNSLLSVSGLSANIGDAGAHVGDASVADSSSLLRISDVSAHVGDSGTDVGDLSAGLPNVGEAVPSVGDGIGSAPISLDMAAVQTGAGEQHSDGCGCGGGLLLA